MKMQKYRKKPVIIEAMQYLGPFSLDEMREEWGEEFSSVCTQSDLGVVTIKTLEGMAIEGIFFVTIGDFIIKGVKGEFYPCKPDIFEATYEFVGE
jgi:hypothetical protein